MYAFRIGFDVRRYTAEVQRTLANAASLASHLSHLHRRLDDFMRDASRRDYSLEPLRELTSQALRGAIRRCGRGGSALSSPESSAAAAAAATAARALSTARLLTVVVALSRWGGGGGAR